MLIFFTSSWLMERLECGSVKSSIMGIWTTRCQIITKAYVLSYDCKVWLSLGGSKNEFWICFIFTSCTSNTGMPLLLFFFWHSYFTLYSSGLFQWRRWKNGWMDGGLDFHTVYSFSILSLSFRNSMSFLSAFLNSLQYKKKL